MFRWGILSNHNISEKNIYSFIIFRNCWLYKEDWSPPFEGIAIPIFPASELEISVAQPSCRIVNRRSGSGLKQPSLAPIRLAVKDYREVDGGGRWSEPSFGLKCVKCAFLPAFWHKMPEGEKMILGVPDTPRGDIYRIYVVYVSLSTWLSFSGAYLDSFLRSWGCNEDLLHPLCCILSTPKICAQTFRKIDEEISCGCNARILGYVLPVGQSTPPEVSALNPSTRLPWSHPLGFWCLVWELNMAKTDGKLQIWGLLLKIKY